MKPLGGFGVELKQGSPRLVLAIVVAARPPLFDHGNSRPRRQLPHRCRKIEMFVIHYETKNTPANPAAEAMKRLPLRADREGGRLFLMERAERLEVRAGAFEGKVRADHFDDVVRRCDLFDIL